MGTTMRELLAMAGGVRPGHQLKFWTPGGSSTPYFTAEHLDVPLDFDSVAAAGSMLGTTALMVFDDPALRALRESWDNGGIVAVVNELGLTTADRLLVYEGINVSLQP